jgi:hypothetical protein
VIVEGDAAATAENISSSAGLFRLGFAVDLVVFLSDVAVAVLFYVLFRPVSQVLALLVAAFRIVQSAILGINLLHHYSAILLLGERADQGALAPAQVDTLIAWSLDMHAYGYLIALTFFGVQLAILGYLCMRSGFVPKALGLLLVLAAFGYLIDSFLHFLVPSYGGALSPVVLAPAVVGELALALWLIFRGVDTDEWDRRASGGTARHGSRLEAMS